jgi:hypothetical protein
LAGISSLDPAAAKTFENIHWLSNHPLHRAGKS